MADWIQIGETVVVKSEADVQKYQTWNNVAHQGERCASFYTINIPLPNDLPNWLVIPWWIGGQYDPLEISKMGIGEHIEAQLKAKGCEIWRPFEWKGNTLAVYHTAGIAPLVVVAIIVAVLIAIGILSIIISMYVVRIKVEEQQQEEEMAVTEATIEAINAIEDPVERARLLAEYMDKINAAHLAETEVVSETSLFGDLGIKEPLLLLVLMIGLVGALFVFMKTR